MSFQNVVERILRKIRCNSNEAQVVTRINEHSRTYSEPPIMKGKPILDTQA